MAFVALLALYWSRQVCMRALPALSCEYFGATLVGKTALLGILVPAAADALDCAEGFVGVTAPVADAPAADGAGWAGLGTVLVAADVVPAPHCALRKSFHFWPLRVPACLASLYFALHSVMLSALVGEIAANAVKPERATAHKRNFA